VRIQVLYFAIFRERIGTDAEVVELPAGARLAEAISALEARHPAVLGLRGRYRIGSWNPTAML
jgi:molybdopterin synthase catalytic subunit